jgi:methyl-accepting chemotaxis protein
VHTSTPKKTVRQRYFIPKEIRVSIAMLVLWSFLAVGFFIYLVKAIGGVLEGYGPIVFIAVLAGYAFIVALLTVVFSNRLIGPFKRLNSEIDTIIAGDFQRRLMIRDKDDIAVRTFVDQINRVIEKLEETRTQNEGFLVHVVSELSDMLGRVERKGLSREELRAELQAIHKELCSFIEQHKFRP